MSLLEYGEGVDSWTILRLVLNRASKSKLSTADIVFLLKFGREHQEVLSTSVPVKPQSGSIFIFDNTVTKNYKKDQHNWKKKKGSSLAVREDHVRLKLNKVPRVIARHVHSIDVETFQRRSYTDQECANQNIVVVHYLDSEWECPPPHPNCHCLLCRLESGGLWSSDKCAECEPLVSSQKQVAPKVEDHLSFSFDADPLPWGQSDAVQREVRHTGSRGSHLPHEQRQRHQHSVGWSSGFPNEPTQVTNRIPDARYHQRSFTAFHSQQRPSRHGQTASLGSLDGIDVNSDALLSEMFMLDIPDREQFRDAGANSGSFAVVDYSPKTTFASGGETFIVVLSPPPGLTWDSHGPVVPPGSRMRVLFGGECVDGDEIANGVIRFVAPRCRNGATEIQLVLDGQLCAHTKNRQPLTVKVQKQHAVPGEVGKTTRFPMSESAVKKRVSKRKYLASGGGDGQGRMPTNNDTKIVSILQTDDLAVDSLGDDELSELSEVMLERVVRLLVDLANQEKGLHAEIDALDESGFNLLHYTIMYSHPKLVSTLLEFGANPAVQTRSGDTPLHLAAEIGSEPVADLLLAAARSDPCPRDASGFLPSQVAANLGHEALARKLASRDGGQLGPLPCPPPLPAAASPEVRPFPPRARVGSWESSAAGNSSPGEGSAAGLSPGQSCSPRSGMHDKHVKLLRDALGQMSLRDKMALTLSVSALEEPALDSSPELRSVGRNSSSASLANPRPDDVRSIVSENEQSVRAAISVMGNKERKELEQEASIIQSNFRRWMLRKNFQDVRQATLRLQKFTKGILSRKTGAVAYDVGGGSHHSTHGAKKVALFRVNEEVVARPTDANGYSLPSSAPHGTNLEEHSESRISSDDTREENRNLRSMKGSVSREQFDGLKRQLSASLVIQKTVREHLNRKKQMDGGNCFHDELDLESNMSTLQTLDSPTELGSLSEFNRS